MGRVSRPCKRGAGSSSRTLPLPTQDCQGPGLAALQALSRVLSPASGTARGGRAFSVRTARRRRPGKTNASSAQRATVKPAHSPRHTPRNTPPLPSLLSPSSSHRASNKVASPEGGKVANTERDSSRARSLGPFSSLLGRQLARARMAGRRLGVGWRAQRPLGVAAGLRRSILKRWSVGENEFDGNARFVISLFGLQK